MKVAIVSLGRSHLINLARFFDEKEDVEVTFYTMMPKQRCRKFGYKGKVRSFLFPIGIAQAVVDRLPGVDPYKKSSMRFRLRKAFDRLVAKSLKRCDYLIGLNGCAAVCSMAAKKKYGAVTVCDQGSSHIRTQDAAHYSYSNVPLSEWNTEYMLKHYKAVDYFMAACDYVVKSDLDNGIEKERILLNPYGVDLDLFTPTERPGDDSFDVIMVGSWWKHKGCDMLMDACLNKLGLKLLHVGSVIDCQIPDTPNFKHVDAVPEFDLPSYYAKAKVFAMCSVDEGFGLVLLQAAACGLPVVGSSRTGLSSMADLLNNHNYCIEVEEPLCVETICDALKVALSLPNALHDGKRQPFEDNLKNISWDAYGNRYFEILKSLTN